MTIAIRRSDLAHRGFSSVSMILVFIAVSAAALGQVAVEPQAEDKDQQGKSAPKNASANSIRQRDTGDAPRIAHGHLRAFYDVSFHSVPDSAAVNLADYLVDQRFWQRRPTVVVVTPISPNVLQPDEGHAEALTEALMRQIAADLGVREVHDKVSQTIGFLRKLGKKAKSSEAESDNENHPPVEQATAEQ